MALSSLVEYTIPWKSDKERKSEQVGQSTRFCGTIQSEYLEQGIKKGFYVIPERMFRDGQWYRFVYPESPPMASSQYPHLFTIDKTTRSKPVGLISDLTFISKLPSSFQVYATQWNE